MKDARREQEFEAFKEAWQSYPSQDNEGYVPDRGGFKCGWFAALEWADSHPDTADKHPLLSLVKPHFFWSRVEVKNPKECWPWKGSASEKGYGRFQVNDGERNRNIAAHRASMFLFGHDLPKDMVVDHKCRNRICVNPEHLRIVTPAENTLEENSEAISAKNARKTHCNNGHEFTEENTYQMLGRKGRCCRTCKAKLNREYECLRSPRPGRYKAKALKQKPAELGEE